MQVITKLPDLSGAVKDALIREIRTGFQLVKANEKKEEIIAARQAEQMKGHRTIPGLGKCVAMMPPDEYYRLITKFGHAEVKSKEFLRYYQKKFPHLSPNRI
jgi:hypothetical protein